MAGPQGIATAISDANGDPKRHCRPRRYGFGWGAGQTGTALGILAQNDTNPANDDHGTRTTSSLVILDNNTNRAGGGFWTTYGLFAPLLLTSAEPTPNDTGVPVLDVAYEYNINSDAPVDPLNPFALGNSLAAYVYDYGAEQTTVIPTKDMQGQPLKPGVHYVVQDGVVVEQYPAPGTADNPNTSTIFVTVKSDNLPLTRPLRLIPGGDILANALDPTLTELVNAGYADTKGVPGEEAIPVDPGKPRPMQPGSSIGALGDVPGSVPIGLNKGVDTAKGDVTNPTNLVTRPIGEAGKLPLISSLPSLTNTSTLSPTGGNLFSPPKNSGTTASTGGANPVKNFTDKIKDAVNNATGGLKQGLRHRLGDSCADVVEDDPVAAAAADLLPVSWPRTVGRRPASRRSRRRRRHR